MIQVPQAPQVLVPLDPLEVVHPVVMQEKDLLEVVHLVAVHLRAVHLVVVPLVVDHQSLGIMKSMVLTGQQTTQIAHLLCNLQLISKLGLLGLIINKTSMRSTIKTLMLMMTPII